MRVFDAGFGHPRGLAGRLGGLLMARGNRAQERRAVEQAGRLPRHQVLGRGHRPGVGRPMAAAAVAPDGRVVGVDPSATMRRMAAARCADLIRDGRVELRDGSAEHTGCPDVSFDRVISVNNVMLWDRRAGFAEVLRVLRPGGRLVVTVHRHVLDVSPDQLRDAAVAAGFADVTVRLRERKLLGPAVELLAGRP